MNTKRTGSLKVEQIEDSNFKNMLKKREVQNFTLAKEKIKYFGEVFNSTCLPSGNLVEGLPLDLHNTDARGF